MSRIVAAVLIALLAGGCSSAEGTMSPAPDPLTAASATPAPTPTSSSPIGTPTPTASAGARFGFQESVRREDAELDDVVAFAGGFVAVGCVLTPPDTAGPCERGLILVSPDGRSWREVAVPNAEQRRINAVGVTSLGLLALGSTQEFEPPRHRAMWRSLDGENWETYDMPAPTSILFEMATTLSGRTVLIGSDSAYDFMTQTDAWATVDGLTWSAGTTPLSAKVAAHPGLVAVGDECVDLCPDDASTRVFRSADGFSWTEGEVPTDMARIAVMNLANLAGRAVVTGVASEAGSNQFVVWTDEPAGWRGTVLGDTEAAWATRIVPAAGGLIVAGYDEAAERPSAWWSADGQSWVTARLDGIEGGSITASAGDDPVVVILDWTSIWVSDF